MSGIAGAAPDPEHPADPHDEPAPGRGRGWLRSPRWRGPLIPLVVLALAGAALVVHGEPPPVQRNSGVSVPIQSATTSVPDAPPPLVVLADGALRVMTAGVPTPLPLAPGDLVLSLQQVAAGASVGMVVEADGLHAQLLYGGELGPDLGRADRAVPGASPAVAALQLGDQVTRVAVSGLPVGPPITLPAGMSLAADTSLGVLASSAVGPIPVVADASRDGGQPTATAQSAMQRGDLWVPLGNYQPLSAHGDIALLWDPTLSLIRLLDLRLLSVIAAVPSADLADQVTGGASGTSDAVDAGVTQATSSAADTSTSTSGSPGPTDSLPANVARSLLPVSYPSLPGLSITGPASFSPDGLWVTVAAQVGQRPRLLVGQVPSALVHGETTLAAMDVISLGGDLGTGQDQCVPVWSGGYLAAARQDGSVVLFSTATRKAVGHDLTPSLTPDPTGSTATATDAPPLPTGSADPVGSAVIGGLGPA